MQLKNGQSEPDNNGAGNADRGATSCLACLRRRNGANRLVAGGHRAFAKYWLSMTLSLFVTACDTGQLPHDAVITVSPESRRFAITSVADRDGRCIFDESHYQDIPVVISLRDAQGSPMTHAQLAVYADYAGNSYPGLAVLGLYDDNNGNGVIDEDSELVSDTDDGVFNTRTDRYNGDRQFWLRINLSCPFAGEVRAFAGDLTARVRVDVTAATVLVAPSGGQARR